jgi:glycine betaine/proline transport system substrate-binding protein
MLKNKWYLVVTVLVALCIAQVPAVSRSADQVVIAQQTWDGSIATANIFKYVLENKLNIPTAVKSIGQPPTYVAMDKGDGSIDVKTECWWPNEDAFFKKYVDERKTVEMSLLFGNAPQGWVVPTWVAKKCNIKTYKDLIPHAKLFDITGDGRGDLWCGGGGWTSTQITRIQMRDLGLEEHFRPLVLEVWVFLAQLKEAMRKKKEIVFYYWAPEWIWAKYDLTWVDLPPYEDSKWKYVPQKPEESHITCGWRSAKVYTGYGVHLKNKNQKAYRFFKNIYLPMEEQSKMIAELADVPGNPPKLLGEVAKWWVQRNPKIVGDWLKGVQ